MLVRGYASVVGNTVNFSNTQLNTINSNLLTVVLSNATNGNSFRVARSGIWAISAYASFTTNTQLLWMDVSTVDATNVAFNTAGNLVIAADSTAGAAALLSWTGYLSSNSANIYKFRINGTANNIAAWYLQWTFLYETPTVAGGNFPFT